MGCSVMILLLAVTVAMTTVVIGDKFTALVELEKVLHAEGHIASDIDEYIRTEQTRLENLRRVADDYKKHSDEALKDKDSYLANPVNAYLLVKRFTLDWNNIYQALIQNKSGQDFIDKINVRLDDFPDGEDLDGTITALLRLQDTYQIPASKIAMGEIAGVNNNKTTELNAADCFNLGRFSYLAEDFYHTFIWMSQALEQVYNGDTSVDRVTIIDHLSFAASKQGNLKYALQLTEELLDLEPSHERAYSNKIYYEKLLAENEANGTIVVDGIQNPKQANEYQSTEEFTVYERLCRGEDTYLVSNQLAVNHHRLRRFKKRPSTSTLVCSYKDFGRPWLLYGPVKVEVVHDKPRIMVFHDVMSDLEIERIKQLASPKLKRATIQNAVTGKLEYAKYRISKSAWLRDESDPVCETVNRRIQGITGLTIDTAEDLQVVNYGIGGHYEPHFDFARKSEIESFKSLGTGNRIATLLFYMSDVQAGGATVFPYIGVKLFPIKGAAAFWFNLHSSGEGDYLTRHAACPVLAGSKWVCNKWFHERGHEFIRPCSLVPDHPETIETADL